MWGGRSSARRIFERTHSCVIMYRATCAYNRHSALYRTNKKIDITDEDHDHLRRHRVLHHRPCRPSCRRRRPCLAAAVVAAVAPSLAASEAAAGCLAELPVATPPAEAPQAEAEAGLRSA